MGMVNTEWTQGDKDDDEDGGGSGGKKRTGGEGRHVGCFWEGSYRELVVKNIVYMYKKFKSKQDYY